MAAEMSSQNVNWMAVDQQQLTSKAGWSQDFITENTMRATLVWFL